MQTPEEGSWDRTRQVCDIKKENIAHAHMTRLEANTTGPCATLQDILESYTAQARRPLHERPFPL